MTKEGRAEGTGGRWGWGEHQSRWMRYLLLLLAVGVVLMSLSNKPVRDVDADVPASPPAAEDPFGPGGERDYARALERLVQETIMQLHGVQRVHVALTLAGGRRKELAETVTTERRTNEGPGAGGGGEGRVLDERTSSQPVLVRSDQTRQEMPVVLVEYLPAIEGVVVVTDAAGDSRVRLEIARAVATLLGVPSHRVYVLPQSFE